MSVSSVQNLANALRFLAVDAVQKANSGHPGMPLGMADIASVLWRDFLVHNPENPHWLNRDRFIISNGHGSMLLYGLLHLTGYDLTIEDLKNFRQLHSKTPGHPEFGRTPGVETTTGPLGQGLANAVGMALAEQILAAEFNRPDFKILDHYTYVFAGDGCLMEGISHEVCSLAGTLGIGKLIVFWDDNGISIDGHVEKWFSENVPERFRAYGWQVIPNVDGHNQEAIRKAILEARAEENRPTLICCQTVIGWGAPTMADKSVTHGSPLGEKEIAAMRQKLNWSHAPFVIPKEIYAAFDAREQGQKHEAKWQELFNAYQKEFSELSEEFLRRMSRKLDQDQQIKFSLKSKNCIEKLNLEKNDVATRQASQQCLEVIAPHFPELIGGAADLTPSVLTNWSGSQNIDQHFFDGNYIQYGVREFGMCAIMNGLALHGGFIPYGGTFLVFTSYAHSAIRMAAMMQLKVIYILTHDSIGLGEDGPTHQPIEQLAMLRMTPNLMVWRPCDIVETMVAWQMALTREDGPTVLSLSRQKLAQQKRDPKNLEDIKRGGYILKDCEGIPEVILIATGSEVEIAAKALDKLVEQGKRVRLVSMPCAEIFSLQDAAYQEKVLPRAVKKRLAVEAAHPDYWYKWVGSEGKIIGVKSYGESAPTKDLYQFFGFTVEKICEEVLSF